MNRFSIVEFEDGLQLVPTKWLKGSSECFWPKHGNIKRLHKNIFECEDPDDVHWDIVKVVRIFGTANSYESGITKVKLAEQFSDIDSSDVDDTKKNRRGRAKISIIDSDKDDDRQIASTLPPPPKKPSSKTLPIINSNNNKPMDESSLENNAKGKHSNNETLLQSVQNISKKHSTPETSVSKNNGAIDIELQKELLRKLNKIDAKLNLINDRLHNIEEKLDSGIDHKNKEYFDIAEVALFPLKTKTDLEKLELDLQNADVFKNTINFMKHLGGKTYHEMTIIILKHTISNFLSTLYCWNGKDGKKAAFKDLLLAKCIKRKPNYDEKFVVKKYGYAIYEKL